MPHCDQCGHHHIDICGCGCPRKACPKCKHQHGRKYKNGRCQWCACRQIYEEGQEEKKK